MASEVTSAQTDWALHADLYAFLGNSLLAPLRPDAAMGLDPAFWDAWACDGANEHVRSGIATLKEHAARCADLPLEQAMQQVNVEYARLFVGPPKPAAPPWETLNRNPDATCGFGEATFAMRELLRQAGLRLRNENHQYEDHLGIELLYLSSLCARADADAADAPALESVADFIEKHPLSWVDAFRARIAEAAPDGYFVSLAGLARALLAWHAEALRV